MARSINIFSLIRWMRHRWVDSGSMGGTEPGILLGAPESILCVALRSRLSGTFRGALAQRCRVRRFSFPFVSSAMSTEVQSKRTTGVRVLSLGNVTAIAINALRKPDFWKRTCRSPSQNRLTLKSIILESPGLHLGRRD